MDHMVSGPCVYNPICFPKDFPINSFSKKKIECSKVGTKGTIELVPDIRAELKLRLFCAEVPTILEAALEVPSSPVTKQEVLTLAA